MLGPGARIRDYEVWGRLGGGGMSDVWLARHAELAIPVIVKTLKPDLEAPADERVRRMLSEARLMARILSPYVVHAYDVGTHHQTPYLAQEYVDGIDLNELDHARRDALGRGLPLWFVCDSVVQIAHALHSAHQHGVLHRDLKPSNLFGSPELGVMLGDFGVACAKRIGERALAEASGTARFMSPEALRGEALDRRADVYGLGATAFDLRYGTPPHPDPRVLLNGSPHPVFPSPVSAQEAYFQHVLSHMLAPQRDQRYRTIAEPRRLLRSLAQNVPRPPSPKRIGDDIWYCGTRISAETGDLARVEVDGIINSANSRLQMRTGVGDALRRFGGDEIEEDTLRHGDQPLGACVASAPGRLACRKVLHAVSAWEQASCVGRATQRALLLAERMGLVTIAFPALGTGAARVSLEASAVAMAAALRWHLALGGSRLNHVRFVLVDDESCSMFSEVLESALLGDDDAMLDLGLAHQVGLEDGCVSVDAATYVQIPSSGTKV